MCVKSSELYDLLTNAVCIAPHNDSSIIVYFST